MEIDEYIEDLQPMIYTIVSWVDNLQREVEVLMKDLEELKRNQKPKPQCRWVFNNNKYL